jgi:heme A synthase
MNSALHHRITTVFGIFLILMAALILVSAERPTRVGVVVVAVGLGLLGLDAVIGGVRKRRPLVSRIGPLP